MRAETGRILAEYEAFHRDRVNRWSHALGLPLIAVSLFHALDGLWGLPLGGRSYGLGVIGLVLLCAFHAILDFRLGWLTNFAVLALHGFGFLLSPAGISIVLGLGLAAPLIGHVVFERQAPKLARIGRFEMAGGLWLTAYILGEPPLAPSPDDR